MKTTFTKADFARWGSQGGQKARHALSPEKARAMVKAREDRKKGATGQPWGKEHVHMGADIFESGKD